MRIISGIHKGRKLFPPKNLQVRPTTSRSKEALFNILNSKYEIGSFKVLDLFAGTGSISLEFASRGATMVYAVDKNKRCIKYIDETAMKLNLNINTIKNDAYKFIEKCNLNFDLIFADPPYEFEEHNYDQLIITVFKKNILNKDGALIIEHDNFKFFENYNEFNFSRKYGTNIFSFFKNKKAGL